MSRLSRLDLAVGLLSLVLLLALGLVLGRGDRVGVSVLGHSPSGSLAAASAPISIAFGEAMDAASVETRFTLRPETAGKFIWRSNTIYFLPEEALTAGQTYTVRLAAGAATQLGHLLADELSWQFTVRPAGVVFLRDTGSGAELWGLLDLADSPRQLTDTGGQVFDFAVSVDGEQILYSAFNELAGIDLWLADREDHSSQMVVNCAADRCYAPAWSADGRVAYSRAPGPLNPGEGYGAPRIWLLDPTSGETLRLHADTQKIGYGPSWSPDAGRLAYFDGVQSRIVVVDMLSGQETYLPSRVGVVGSWTRAGGQMLYYDTQLAEGQAVNAVFRADFDTQDIVPFFDPQPNDGDYSTPVLSPDEQWVALRVRPAGSGPADQIWVTPMDGRYALTVDETSESLFSNLAWDPQSEQLLYHRMQLGTANPTPEVWVWERNTAQAHLLVRDASAPAWLP